MTHVCAGRHRNTTIIGVERGLCDGCTHGLRRALRSLMSDWTRLCDAVGDHIVTEIEHVSGTPVPAVPLNTPVLALRATLSELCEAALCMVAPGLGIDVRERHKARGWPVRDHPPVLQAVKVLPHHVKELLAAQPQPICVWDKAGTSWRIEDLDGVDIALQLMSTHHGVDCLLGEENPRQRLAMPCPRCGAPMLGIDNGASAIDCRSCGGSWPQSEYDWLAGFIISEHEHKERTDMLEWLLAEAKHEYAQSETILAQVRRLAELQAGDLVDIDGFAVVELLREMLGMDIKKPSAQPA